MTQNFKIREKGGEIITPAFQKDNVPLVIACDNNYVPFTSVLLTSLAENSHEENNYDIILFQKDITEDNKFRLIDCLRGKQNISLRFFDVSENIKNYSLRVHSYYSVEIYFRLFAPWILDQYDKVLYCDCDLVFNTDIADLYKINIGDNFLGAVRDIGMILHKNYERSGIPKSYYSEFLQKIDIHNYFNSGVLVMNLEKFRREMPLEQIMGLIQAKKWLFPDQDVLNVLCAEKTYILPSGWNTLPENSGDRNLANLKKFVPTQYYVEYLESRENPFIVHYAMREKPWKWSINLDKSLGLVFWKYALRSPLAAEVIKEKLRSCSLGEMMYILRYFKEHDFSVKEYPEEIVYLFENVKVYSYSSRAVKFETAAIDGDCYVIDGWFEISDGEKMPDKFILRSDNAEYYSKLISKNQKVVIDGDVYAEAYVFRVKIPLSDITGVCKFVPVFSVAGKEITAKICNYGRFFPTDRLISTQYSYDKGFIIQCSGKNVTISAASAKKRKIMEKAFRKNLKKIGGTEKKKNVILRRIYHFFKPFFKKQIWIVQDNFLNDDNGIAFFEYLVGAKPKNVKFYFALNRMNERFEELKKKYPRRTLVVGTKRYKFWSLLADAKLSSIVDMAFIRPFKGLEHDGRDIYNKQHFVFLQHGVTNNDMSREHNKYVYNPARIVTVSECESEEFRRECYFYEKDQIVTTGFARFDKLRSAPKRIISIVPTWRKYLLFKNGVKENISDEEFMQSSYFKFYYSLLNDPRLNESASKYGYKIAFMQHPLFLQYDHCFEHENMSYSILNEKHRDVFAKSDLLVSDYSSVIFDFLYLRKPIIYTHFDRDEFYSGGHAYDKGFIDHENDGFGECEYTLDSTVDRLIEYMSCDCKIKPEYLEKINEFFAYGDENNSKRIAEATYQMVKDAGIK